MTYYSYYIYSLERFQKNLHFLYSLVLVQQIQANFLLFRVMELEPSDSINNMLQIQVEIDLALN